MRVEDWGLIEYGAAVEKQLQTLEQVAAGADEVLIFCTHPPVVTLGRATTKEDLLGWSGAVFESSRGGRATYHGPSQIVVYPILDLRTRGRDVHLYLRQLEGATVKALQALGLESAEARNTPVGGISLTGVWVGEHKIASIGIAVRKWITYHGVAINVRKDPTAFQGIRPCGFQSGVMTSLENELGTTLDGPKTQDVFAQIFLASFAK